MSCPRSSKCVANECRSVCDPTGLKIPAFAAPLLIARWIDCSYKWCRRRTPLRGSFDSCGAGNTQNHGQLSPARGYLLASAPGSSTPARSAARSTPHNAREYASCLRNTGTTADGSIVTRSFFPLPSRTKINPRSKSTSFTRRRRHSILRIPVPYSSCAMQPSTPDIAASSR